MHLLITSPYFFPALHYGGPTTATLDLARFLVRAGVKVTVFTSDSLNSKKRIGERHIQKDGIDIFYFRNRSNTISSHFLYFDPLGFEGELRRRIHEFDAVHINEFRVHMSYRAARIATQFRKPCILQPHGAMPIAIQRQALKKFFDLIMGNWLLRNVDKVACLNAAEEQSALAFGVKQQRILRLTNGIDLELLQPVPSTSSIRKEFSLSDNAKIILFLGRLHQKKGIDLLIEALGLVKDPNLHLVLAGSDYAYKNFLEKQIASFGLKSQVHFAGFVEGQRKQILLESCDLFVLASRFEGLPVGVLEAMAMKKPVIISKACNLPEVAKHNAGFEIDANARELAQKIAVFFAMTKSEQTTMGENGHRLVKEKFTWPQIVENYIGEIKKLVNFKK